jgi:hypothetical protein
VTDEPGIIHENDNRSCLIAAIVLATGAGSVGRAQEAHPSDLSANDLAEALNVHWWTVQLPHDLGPNDDVGVEAISSDGKTLEGPSGFSEGPGGKKIEGPIRVFCRENEVRRLIEILIKLPDGSIASFPIKDYFE